MTLRFACSKKPSSWRAKNKQPESPTYHYHLGQAYEKAEKPVVARQQFERVLKIDPNYTDAADIRKQLAQLKS